MGREPSVVLGFWHYHCYERYILQRFEKLLAPEKEDKSIFDKSKKLDASVVDATRDLVPGTNFGELLVRTVSNLSNKKSIALTGTESRNMADGDHDLSTRYYRRYLVPCT